MAVRNPVLSGTDKPSLALPVSGRRPSAFRTEWLHDCKIIIMDHVDNRPRRPGN